MSAAATGRARPPLLLPFAITATALMANSLINPAIPDVLDDFGVTAEATRGTLAGLIVASTAIPGIVLAPVSGLLADRFGRRAVLVPSLTVFGVAGTLGGLAPSIGWLVVSRMLMGGATAALIGMSVVIIGDHWEGLDRARLVGQNAAVLTTAVAVWPLVGGALSDAFGWRWHVLPVPLALVTAALVAARLPPLPRKEVVPLRAQLAAAGPHLRSSTVLASLAFGFVLFLLIFGLFLAVMPEHLDREFGLSASARGLVVAVPAVGSTLAALSLGRLRARVGPRALLLATSVSFAGAFAVIGLTEALPVLVVAAAAYGVGEGLGLPTIQDVVAGAAPAEHRGVVVSLFVGAARAGQAAGPLLAGAVVGTLTTGGTFLAGSAVAAGLVLAQLALRRGVSRRGGGPSAPVTGAP